MSQEFIQFITRIASLFIALVLGGALVPVINYLKVRTGLSGRAALAVSYVVGTLGALALLWLVGVGAMGVEDVTADYLLSFAALIFVGNQAEYTRQKRVVEKETVEPIPATIEKQNNEVSR